jgi:Fe-S-cluster containining protein
MIYSCCDKNSLSKLSVVKGKINFVCLMDECPCTCCGPFGGVQRDIDSIEGRKFHDIFLTSNDSKRLLISGCAHVVELLPSNVYRMLLLEDGTCCALKNGLCSIHQAKPTLCRAFPFYIDMFVGLCGVTSCPGFGQGWTYLEDLAKEIEAAGQMYQFWIDSLSYKSLSAV